ncbi:hypothetical protein [Variovorax sp. EBFNA2]|uniref:hypothetical protein n=1 Tax=Variovorax sp. EBFNA2 TaxID=3342097 RepID=UPI0029C074A3|nr:hypothetical protein [Variovorax boronicumulans]WPG40314.1 hypothetical protein RZE79_13480 [Variovorax boronicumulans]
MKKPMLAIALVAATQCHAATIYLCKAYNGSTFWAQAHCNQHNAFIERIVPVADVPWDQQVQQAQQGLQLQQAPRQQANVTMIGAGSPQCKVLDDRVRELDSMARQPQSASSQGWIAEERKKARDQRFRIGC